MSMSYMETVGVLQNSYYTSHTSVGACKMSVGQEYFYGISKMSLIQL